MMRASTRGRRRMGLAAALLVMATAAGATAAPQDARVETDRAPFLDDYVGRYQLSERFFLDITRVGDALYVEATGQRPTQLTPRTRTEFVIVGSSLRLMFETDPITRQVTHIIFEQGGFGRRAEKLETTASPPPPAAVSVREEVLARYVGTYAEQPGFAIEITLDDGDLRAGFTGADRERIQPASETEFFYEHSTARISFELDGEGRATHLILHQGGSDVRMDRVDE